MSVLKEEYLVSMKMVQLSEYLKQRMLGMEILANIQNPQIGKWFISHAKWGEGIRIIADGFETERDAFLWYQNFKHDNPQFFSRGEFANYRYEHDPNEKRVLHVSDAASNYAGELISLLREVALGHDVTEKAKKLLSAMEASHSTVSIHKEKTKMSKGEWID